MKIPAAVHAGDITEVPYQALLSEQEVDKWRDEFKILETIAHLGNCSQSPQSNRVRAALEQYLDNWLTIGMDWDGWMEEVGRAKAQFARLIGAQPDEIAVAASVSDLVSSVANALDYSGERRKVVVTDAEFPTVDYVWLANARHGAKVDFVPVGDDHTIGLEQYDRHIDKNTLLTSVTHVYYLNGFKQDLAAIANLAHARGSLLLVDAYQGLGTEPVNVREMGIDILVSGCLKYLLGVPGIAFMYVARELVERLSPTITGWFGQSDPFLFQTRYNDWSKTASRFDTGTPPIMAAYAARAGLEIICEVGPDKIKDRIDMLSAYALRGCAARGLATLSPLDVRRKGSTTAVLCGHRIDSHDMEIRLRERGVIASGRGDVIRLAPHFYSKTGEIDKALDAISQILES